MHKLLILLNLITILFIIGCREEVSKPFDLQRYNKEGNEYLEKYSELLWSNRLDSIVNSSDRQKRINDLIEIYGDNILRIEYMLDEYYESSHHNIWLLKNREFRSLGYYGIPDRARGLDSLPECIIEMYAWGTETGDWIEIYYLRKGKELMPIDYSVFKEHNYWFE